MWNASRLPLRRQHAFACAAVTLAAAGTGVLSARADAAVTAVANADAFVAADRTSTNYGGDKKLVIDGSPIKTSYIRFDVPGGGSVARATLRVFANARATAPLRIGTASSTWDERRITYATAPAVTPSTATIGPFTNGVWVTADVTSLVTAGQTATLAISAPSGIVESAFSSRESGGNKGPRLDVDFAPTGQPPVNTTAPSISGRAVPGEDLTGDGGAWAGAGPIGLAYQWRRCDAGGAGCGDIAGATSSTYRVVDADRAHALRLAVTASNEFGGTSATSAATLPVRDPFLMAAGDIACNADSSGAACKQMETSDLMVAADPDAVVPLGDNQYECGQLGDFNTYYGPSWGRLMARTRPAVGNHEYTTSFDPANHCYALPGGAPGYYSYFGSIASPLDIGCVVSCKGYYSWDMGDWHMIALNSNCVRNGNCRTGDPQLTWLASDLAAHPNQCTLAYWHHPLFTSGQIGPTVDMRGMYQMLYDAGVDVILNGHDHDYERFAPMDPQGNVDAARGIREFIVGTGGRNTTSFAAARPGSEVRNSTTYGVMKMTLEPGRYRWQFQPIAGSAFTDAGSQPCHIASAADTTPPTDPSGLNVAETASNTVDMNWTASSDDVGVVAYRIYRDGSYLTSTGSVTGFTDATAGLGATYAYEVRGVDASGNVSGPTNSASVTMSTIPSTLQFSDGFETGTLSRWTTNVGLRIQSQFAFAGNFAVRATTTDGLTYAYHPLTPVEPDLYYRLHFQLFSRSSSFSLLKMRNSAGATALTATVSSTGKLGLRNGLTGVTINSPVVVENDEEWHELEVHLDTTGTGLAEVHYDGSPVPALSLAQTFSATPIDRIQLGDNTNAHTYDIAYDNVALSRTLIP